MRRREAISLLLGAAAARGAAPLGAFFEGGNGSAILLDVRARRVTAAHQTAVAGGYLAPPGSTIKPFVVDALLKSGKLGARESFVCPGRLRIGDRSLNCSHPPMDSPMQPDTALAYSCNCFVAHAAERFGPGELARRLEADGLGARTALLDRDEATGRIAAARGVDAIRLQALGEDGILLTVAELALAYRTLALSAGEPVLAGLEEAVEFGTAQRARVAGVKVAGKTGSVRAPGGARIAWFAGFVPSRAPERVVAVMLQGGSGGADAAPIAGRILAADRAGRW